MKTSQVLKTKDLAAYKNQRPRRFIKPARSKKPPGGRLYKLGKGSDY
jgi:hypothetical protein